MPRGRPRSPQARNWANRASLECIAATMPPSTAYLRSDRKRARNEDLLTERPTLAVPRSCHNA